jgi:hypothetical protein
MKNIQVKKQTYEEQSLFERKENRNLCGSGSRSGSTTLMGTTYIIHLFVNTVMADKYAPN